MKKITAVLVVPVMLGIVFGRFALAQKESPEKPKPAIVKTWDAFNDKDYDEAITLADQCLRQFATKAAQMQAQLDDFPAGPDEHIHQYYALNDAATALYIKGESLKQLGRLQEATEAFQDLIDHYSFGQCWDPRGWFWKPAVVAQEKLRALEAGIDEEIDDYSSMNLMIAAWKALDENDLNAVLFLTDKCINLYEKEALAMQSQLSALPTGTEQQIHAYWALNDVATAYFIRGEAYFKNDELEKAKESYQYILDNLPFAQCWDPRGWFWTVADGAQEKITMIETGVFMDFWDYSSRDLVTKAWQAYDAGDLVRAKGYADKCIQLYTQQAADMSAQVTDFVEGTNEEKHAYWALNDVATALYIKGLAFQNEHKEQEAKTAFQTIIDDYPFAQCWDPRGWWWQPAVAARNWIETLN